MALFAALFFAAGVFAQVDAYSVEVAVSGRSDEQRQAAYQVAMRRVLLGNSGDKTLLNRDDVRNGLRDAEAYVDQFRFRTPEPGTVISTDTPITDTVRRTGKATHLMMVSFNRERINALINARSADSEEEVEPVDPFANLTSALVWMLIEDDNRTILVAGNEIANVQQRSREIAGGAGLSLVFPAGDEGDQAALSVDDIRNADVELIRLASERYAQPVILVAHLRRNRPSGWNGQWTKFAAQPTAPTTADVVDEPAPATTTLTSRSLDQGLQSGISWLSPETESVESRPAYSYGGQGGSSAEVLIWVNSLESTDAYARVMSFLNGIDSVKSVYPKEVNGSNMVFAVIPRDAIGDINIAADRVNWLRSTAPPATTVSSQLGRNAELAFDYLR